MAKQIDNNWRPEDAAYMLLAQHSIPREFIEDLVPEFVLYWMERSEAKHSWTITFVKHAIHAWRKYQANPAGAGPTLMSRDWLPDTLAVQQLYREGMEPEVIGTALMQFKLYWIEHRQVKNSWSSAFLDYARNYQARMQQPGGQSTRDIPLQQQLTDRSWAQGGDDGKL